MGSSNKRLAVVKTDTKEFLIELKKRLNNTEDELISYALAKSFKKERK